MYVSNCGKRQSNKKESEQEFFIREHTQLDIFANHLTKIEHEEIYQKPKPASGN
jgi:hypothetical protein